MKFSTLWKRFCEMFSANTQKAVDKADKNINIETYARQLLNEQKQNKTTIEKHRNEIIRQREACKLQLSKMQERLTRIKRTIIVDSQTEEGAKSVAHKQQVLTAAHEGAIITEQIGQYEEQIKRLDTAFDKSLINLGIVERNTLSLESRLNNITFRDTMAKIKLATYTVEQTENYFSLEKLDEIVDSNEVDANTAEAIHELEMPDAAAQVTTSANDFMQQVLSEKDKI